MKQKVLRKKTLPCATLTETANVLAACRQVAKFVLSVLLLIISYRSSATTYTVTSTGDANTGLLTSGTLRYCINAANADFTATAHTINFALPGSGVQTITLTSALPTITKQVKINGYSQSGALQGSISGRTILIQITTNSSIATIFNIQASNTEICGIAFTVFGTNSLFASTSAQGITVSNVFIWGNYFNTGADGNSTTGSGYAFAVYGKTNALNPYSSNVQSWIIGTNGDGSNDANEGNLFSQATVASGNATIEPVRLFFCDNFIISGNTFGLKKDGLTALQTFDATAGQNYGIALTNCTGIRIGTDGNGVSDALERNVFAGMRGNAVIIFGNVAGGGTFYNDGLTTDINRAQGNNTVAGNYFGTNTTGTATGADLKNRSAVAIIGSGYNTIGSTSNTLLRNVIVNSYQYAISLAGQKFYSTTVYPAGNNTIANNYIGVLSDGTTASGNGGAGIYVGLNDNLSAGDAGSVNNVISKNIIANNGARGVDIRPANTGSLVYDNTVSQNSIYSNTGLGINLGSSATNTAVTPNDGVLNTIASSGTNGNLLPDYAIITAGSLSGNNLTLNGFIGSNAAGNSAFTGATIEFFIAANDGDQNGAVISGDGLSVAHGEGKTYLGTLTAGTNGAFSGTIDVTGKGFVLGTSRITNTVTEQTAVGSTSEFGANTLSISGTVYGDANGLSDNTVNGTGTNGGGLNALLINTTSNTVVATTAVASNGTYSFPIVSPINYTIEITTATAAIGSAPPAVTLPTGYVSTGEKFGSGTGSDGTVDGKLTLGIIAADATNANFGITQAGYIYVHKEAIDENSSTNFTFNVSGGPASVGAVTLNDYPDTNISVQDIGSSQSGRLWAVGMNDNILYYRDMASTVWTATSITNAIRVDGGAGNSAYYVTTTGAVNYFDGTTSTALYTGVDATDVGSAWNNTPYIITSGGLLYQYSGSGSGDATATTVWTQIGTTTNNRRLDSDPVTGNAIVAKGDGNIWRITSSGTATNLGHPSISSSIANDVAVDASGNIYAMFRATSASTASGSYPFKWISGTTWSTEEASGGNATQVSGRITGGIGGQMWLVNSTAGAFLGTIFSRTNNNGTIFWYDNDWVRSGAATTNAEMIPVIPGTYTLTETMPSGWALTGIDIYDPTNNSSGVVSTKTSSLSVAAGEVVHVNYSNQLVNVTTIGVSCGINLTQTFGAGTNTYGNSLTGQTAYHYIQANKGDAGYYSVVKNSSGWPNTTLTDHTGSANGYFLAANASFSANEFYRQRVSGLTVGLTYTLAFWAADLSPASPIRPNVTLGVADVTTGATLNSINTGSITATSWTQYSFTFTATSTILDIFIRNNADGGLGNDIALDDISFNLTPIAGITGTVTSPSSCAGTGSITITAPTGSNIEYSLDGTTFQSSPVFNNVAPGVYTVTDRYVGTTCTAAVQDTILAMICGNVYDDANGLKDTPSGTVNGTGTNAGGLNAILYDNSTGKVAAVAAVGSNGTFSFGATPGDSYLIEITTNSATVGSTTLPAVNIPIGWANVGENLGSAAGSDGTVDGKLSLGTVNASVTNANFGIDQLPSGVDVTYVISPVPTRGSTHALTSAYRNMLPLNYYDPEDCSSTCPANFGVIIQSLGNMNGNVLKYNGITITPPYTIPNYKPDSLTITFNQSGFSSFSFYYVLIDAAGVQSIDPSYNVSWGSTVLAVNLLGFTATQQGTKALLQWSTATGSINDKFTIERSGDGSNWQALTTINGRGNTSTKQEYSYTDNSPLNGDNYYRIRQQDNSGNNSYSQTKLLKFAEAWKVSLSPNPVAGGEVKLVSNKPVTMIRITDLQGRIASIKNMPLTTEQGNVTEKLNTGTLAAGTYLVQVVNGNGKTQTLKLVKW